jgi:AraC-like DNA-binding protein
VYDGARAEPVESNTRSAMQLLDDRRVQRALDYMQDHLAASLDTLATLANEAAVSRFHFVRLFKSAVGITPHAFLIKLRMQEAISRLAAGQDGVGEVAAACGYNNPANFAAAFRRHIGVSPRAYRTICRMRKPSPLRQNENWLSIANMPVTWGRGR